jgi:hypothetical protein
MLESHRPVGGERSGPPQSVRGVRQGDGALLADLAEHVEQRVGGRVRGGPGVAAAADGVAPQVGGWDVVFSAASTGQGDPDLGERGQLHAQDLKALGGDGGKGLGHGSSLLSGRRNGE